MHASRWAPRSPAQRRSMLAAESVWKPAGRLSRNERYQHSLTNSRGCAAHSFRGSVTGFGPGDTVLS